MKKFCLGLICLSVLATEARDTLVLIQAVTTSKKSFALSRGRKDGVQPGQESLFTNRNASIVARATEVTRDYSLWEPSEERAIVPFSKEDFVTMTNAKENIWLELPELHVRDEYIGFERVAHGIFRVSMTRALSESVTGIRE